MKIWHEKLCQSSQKIWKHNIEQDVHDKNRTKYDYAIATFFKTEGKDNFLARKFLEINGAKITTSPYKFVK